MKYLKYFENDSIWSNIDIFNTDTYIYIDSWLTRNVDEEGIAIAKIDKNTEEIIYIDNRAKTDEYAQKEIKIAFDEYFTPEKRLEIAANKYNL